MKTSMLLFLALASASAATDVVHNVANQYVSSH
jgi:hypothetical protein